ncbi:MAG TPA: hypothetical protein VJM31_08005 [Vicinamibacterales bacterium]|nr:hypothetical protein [Vicinamibacterales bacterium]
MDQTIHVWHDKGGRIVAWGYSGAADESPLQAAPLAARNQKVISARVSDRLLANLHETHHVNPKSRALVAKTIAAKKRATSRPR